jgi:hypothetical protein
VVVKEDGKTRTPSIVTETVVPLSSSGGYRASITYVAASNTTHSGVFSARDHTKILSPAQLERAPPLSVFVSVQLAKCALKS